MNCIRGLQVRCFHGTIVRRLIHALEKARQLRGTGAFNPTTLGTNVTPFRDFSQDGGIASDKQVKSLGLEGSQVDNVSKVMTTRPVKIQRRNDAGEFFPNLEQGDQQHYIDRLNDQLAASWELKREVQEGKTPENAATRRRIKVIDVKLFRWYLMARQRLLVNSDKVHPAAWQSLWHAICGPQAYERLARVNYLGSDMLQAGVHLSEEQRLLYIEAKYLHGDKAIAVEEWQANQAIFENCVDPRHQKNFWCLGINLCAANGRIDLAMQAVDRLFSIETDTGVSRMLIPIIQACFDVESVARLGHEQSLQMAWVIYIMMRVKAGDQMTLDDFDEVILAFLDANAPDFALAVFRDMMLAADKNTDPTISLYAKISGSQIDDWKPSRNAIPWEQSIALTTLPPRFNNKFFFGKWIKKLIGDGQPDHAAKVLQVMQDRGIRASAIQVNGLIGAWLRKGTVAARERAESMAWQMITARIAFVNSRAKWRHDLESLGTTMGEIGNENDKQQSVIEINGARPQMTSVGDVEDLKVDRQHDGIEGMASVLPQATIETFSILIQDYRKRHKRDKIQDVRTAIESAELQPDTFFMNQVILSHVRAHEQEEAWQTYKDMVGRQQLIPNLGTFEALFGMIRSVSHPLKMSPSETVAGNVATSRALFAELMAYADALKRTETLSQDLLDIIVRCFCITDDQAGTAVAIRACADRFNIYPTDETVRYIMIHVAHVKHVNVQGHRPRRFTITQRTKDRLSQISQMLALFKQERVELLQKQGIEFDEMDPVPQAEQSMLVVSDLLRYVAQMRLDALKEQGLPVVQNVSEMSQQAAKEMGAPECNTWAQDEFSAAVC